MLQISSLSLPPLLPAAIKSLLSLLPLSLILSSIDAAAEAGSKEAAESSKQQQEEEEKTKYREVLDDDDDDDDDDHDEDDDDDGDDESTLPRFSPCLFFPKLHFLSSLSVF